jgi:hypothetical protein
MDLARLQWRQAEESGASARRFQFKGGGRDSETYSNGLRID